MGQYARVAAVVCAVALVALFGANAAFADVFSGRVFDDDVVGDPGIENVTVALLREGDPEPVQFTTTDVSGNYAFLPVDDGAIYRVQLPTLANVPPPSPKRIYVSFQAIVTRTVVNPAPQPPTVITETEDVEPIPPTQSPIAPNIQSQGPGATAQGVDFPIKRQRSEDEFVFKSEDGSIPGLAFVDAGGNCNGQFDGTLDRAVATGRTVGISFASATGPFDTVAQTTATQLEGSPRAFNFVFPASSGAGSAGLKPPSDVTGADPQNVTFWIAVQLDDGSFGPALQVSAKYLEEIPGFEPAAWEFLLPRVAAGCDLGTYSGRVFEDTNRNGVIDAGDTPQAGVSVQLLTLGGAQVGAIQTTSTTGEFQFPDLVVGIYRAATVSAPSVFSPWTTVAGDQEEGDILLPADNVPPTADAGGPYVALNCQFVQLNGSRSSDPDGAIVSYRWNFGDGSTGSGVRPSHRWNAVGKYTVTLTVTDDGGLTDTASIVLDVVPCPNMRPIAVANGPYAGLAGQPRTLDSTGSRDVDGTIVAYAWDFGDGTQGAGASPTHAWTTAGTYTVTLTVKDDDGATDSATTTALISRPPNPRPTANPGGPYTGMQGQPVVLDGSASSDPDGTIVSYQWSFGDGRVAIGPTPSHTWAAAGTYTVTLRVTDDGGLSDTATTTARIESPPLPNIPPFADAGGPYTAQAGRSLTLDGTGSRDADGRIVSYDWSFGDGATGRGATPRHTWVAAGTYTVTLTVTDDRNARTTAMTEVCVDPAAARVDLDIVYFWASRGVRLPNCAPIRFFAVIANTGEVDEPRAATLVGLQGGREVYRRTKRVSAPVGGWCAPRVYSFPEYRPTKPGPIRWVLTVHDDEPDLDKACRKTFVRAAPKPRPRPWWAAWSTGAWR